MKNISEIILGELQVFPFLAAYFYGIVGILVGLLVHANTRDPNQPGSPIRFSWLYLIQDKGKKIVTNLILLFVAIRFAPELLGADITVYAAFLIGLGIDRIPALLNKKSE